MTDNHSNAPVFSCEFFPPRTEAGREKLLRTQMALTKIIQPAYFSVTFGAGGSTRDSTLETVRKLISNGTQVTPHISCIGSTKKQLSDLLQTYQALGICQLVTLRGDIPEGAQISSDFNHANELVAFIREETGDHFALEVAAYPEYHPESANPHTDFENFRKKIDAGATGAITQYFYNINAYSHFMEKCLQANISIPVTPGIMPISNYARLTRFSDLCGAEIPRWIRTQLEAYADDLDSLQAFGLDVVSSLCQQLLQQGAPGLHFYTLNQIEPTTAIWQRLY